MEQSTQQSKRRSARSPRAITDPAIARIVAQPYPFVEDNGDAAETGRTRAAALAFWLKQNQAEAFASDKLGVVLMEMSRAPRATRHAFMQHIAHLVAVGSQHMDIGADLAQENAAPRGFDLIRKL